MPEIERATGEGGSCPRYNLKKHTKTFLVSLSSLNPSLKRPEEESSDLVVGVKRGAGAGETSSKKKKKQP